MEVLLTILMLLTASLLVLTVIIQNSKGGGLASNIAGAQVASQILGARQAANFVEKGTWWLLGTLFLLTFIYNFAVTSSSTPEGEGNRFKNAIQGSGQSAPTAPAPPATPSNP